MAQYVKYRDPNTGLKVRDGVRDDHYVIDIELINNGFNGTEDVDWENIQTIE